MQVILIPKTRQGIEGGAGPTFTTAPSQQPRSRRPCELELLRFKRPIWLKAPAIVFALCHLAQGLVDLCLHRLTQNDQQGKLILYGSGAWLLAGSV